MSGWLTVAANFGVLGGLVLVIIQLDQNQPMMRAQTRLRSPPRGPAAGRYRRQRS